MRPTDRVYGSTDLPDRGLVFFAADVRLGRMPPFAWDPSSPAFADAGDPPECEILKVSPEKGEVPIAIDQLTETEVNLIEDAAINLASYFANREDEEP